jgi:heptosyltransferase-2
VSSSGGNILVIRGGAIGDFILTLPALAALRNQFPHARLELLGYPHIAQLALAGGLVDRVHPIEAQGLACFFARNGELPESWRDYFSDFDLIISYLFDPDQIFKTNVALCTPAQFIAGPHRPNEVEAVHATRVFLKPLERLAIFEADDVPRLRLNPGARAQPPLLALHPGSGSERKNWPEERWAELIEHLLATTAANLLLVGGEAEGERLQRLAAALPPTRTGVAKNLPLAELAVRLRSCAGFVGHDSGITHLAAALGLACVVLWSDTNETIWRPQGAQVNILREPTGLPRLDLARVRVAVDGLLG